MINRPYFKDTTEFQSVCTGSIQEQFLSHRYFSVKHQPLWRFGRPSANNKLQLNIYYPLSYLHGQCSLFCESLWCHQIYRPFDLEPSFTGHYHVNRADLQAIIMSTEYIFDLKSWLVVSLGKYILSLAKLI